MTDDTIALPPLPTFDECVDTREIDDSELTPVQRFVFDNEPAGVDDEREFREGLTAALEAYAREAVRLDRRESDRKRESLIDVLNRNGFVRCDIAACNCGSWHARFGLRERFDEITNALEEHDVNLNGKTVLSALKEALTELDSLRLYIAGRVGATSIKRAMDLAEGLSFSAIEDSRLNTPASRAGRKQLRASLKAELHRLAAAPTPPPDAQGDKR